VKNYKKITKQFIYYFGVALVGYIADFSTLIILHDFFKVHYLIAAACGFVVGLIILYLLSSRYVFGKSKIQSKTNEFLLFTTIGLVGLVILSLFMWIFTDIFGLNYLISKIIATIFVYAWNFFARRSLYHDK
jgi:putative flippase GtrA